MSIAWYSEIGSEKTRQPDIDKALVNVNGIEKICEPVVTTLFAVMLLRDLVNVHHAWASRNNTRICKPEASLLDPDQRTWCVASDCTIRCQNLLVFFNIKISICLILKEHTIVS